MSSVPTTSPAFGSAPVLFNTDGTPRAVDKYDAPLLMANQGQQAFHIMIKPAGSSCNLNCTYCFYLSKAALADGPGSGRMSDEILECFVRKYLEAVTVPEVIFSWQGGEPTLCGLDFFRRVIALQQKYARPDQTVQNDLQTNGTLLNDEWCVFLKENRFLVGLSIDGPRDIHDLCRRTKDDGPSFAKVMAAVQGLKRYGVSFNTLTCINRYNARRPLDVYRFLRRELGAERLQFIPIVEFKGFERVAPQAWDVAKLPRMDDPTARPGHPESVVTDWSVDPEDWGYFLCKIFDEWRNRDVEKVFVNHFETLLAQHAGMPSQICVYSELCGKGLAIEHDGSIYSCDHYVYPSHRVGHIRDGQLIYAAFSRAQVKFGYAKHEQLPKRCMACAYLRDCWGDCPKNRFLLTPEGEPGLNYLCAGLRQYFAHAIPAVEQILRDIRLGKRRQPTG